MKKIFSSMLCFLLFICPVKAEPELDIKGKSALLMEASTGEIIYEKNSHERLAPASVTKIMTMLLTMEAIDSGKLAYDDIVTASERAKSMGGSTIFLDTGEQMSVHDLLKGIAVASGNDACVAIAEHLAGSESEFVRMMNERAQQLGMTDTNFENTNGLDSPNHYSSAADIALMSRELLKHEKITEFTTIWIDSLRDGAFGLANTNKLIRFYNGANGLKTGSTSKALFCLSGTAKRDNMQLISVVMASPTSNDRFSDCRTMLDYGFSNYSIVKLTQTDTDLFVPVTKGEKDTVTLMCESEFSALIPKGKQKGVEVQTETFGTAAAPVTRGTVLGKATFTLEGRELGCINLVAAEDVQKKTFGRLWSDLICLWLR